MEQYTLLTGATGLVGRYVMRDLLLSGHRLAVVVRGARKAAPEQRVEAILQMWESELGKDLPRPLVLTGDITKPGFGMAPSGSRWIRQNCDTIIHSAAILKFFGSDRSGEPWRTNLNGARNMLRVCRDLGIRDLHYMSTAYVAGLRRSLVMENELDVGQSFRNDYENSKFQAEKLVRDADFLRRVTVYRPAVISGDSVTGYTSTYHGIYLYLRLISMLVPLVPRNRAGKRVTPVQLPITGRERRNIVPIDWVSAVTVRLFETPQAHGDTYHIAPDDPITSGKVVQCCCDYFDQTGVTFVGNEQDVNTEEQPSFYQKMIPDMSTYEAYMHTDNTFDMTNLKRFAGDIPCPKVDRTVIQRYLQFGEKDRWGKRRQPAPVIPFNIADHLSQLVSPEEDRFENALAARDRIGIDIAGPGGGQWSVTLNGARALDVAPGLPEIESPVLRMSALEFRELLEGPTGAAVSDLTRHWNFPEGTPAEHEQLCERTLHALVPGSTVSM